MTKEYNKYVDESDEFFVETPTIKPGVGVLRQDSELFDETKYIPNAIINIKRIGLPNNGESWEILQDNQVAMTLKGIRFSKKEREFLRTTSGMILIINGYKKGWKTTSEFKRQIKQCLKKK